MGGLAASYRSGATSLWVSGGSLVHRESVDGQPQQVVIPLEHVADIEVAPAPDTRLLLGAIGAPMAGVVGAVLAHWGAAVIGLAASLGLLIVYDVARGVRLRVKAPSGEVEVVARWDDAEELARFAHRLDVIRQGKLAHRSLEGSTHPSVLPDRVTSQA